MKKNDLKVALGRSRRENVLRSMVEVTCRLHGSHTQVVCMLYENKGWKTEEQTHNYMNINKIGLGKGVKCQKNVEDVMFCIKLRQTCYGNLIVGNWNFSPKKLSLHSIF
jgi:hypothetical protein